MPMLVKWMDAKGAGVSRWAWRKVKAEVPPVKGFERVFPAWQVEELLKLAPGTLGSRKRAVR